MDCTWTSTPLAYPINEVSYCAGPSNMGSRSTSAVCMRCVISTASLCESLRPSSSSRQAKSKDGMPNGIWTMRYAVHTIVRNEVRVPSKVVPVLISKRSSHSRQTHRRSCSPASSSTSTTRTESHAGLGHLGRPSGHLALMKNQLGHLLSAGRINQREQAKRIADALLALSVVAPGILRAP